MYISLANFWTAVWGTLCVLLCIQTGMWIAVENKMGKYVHYQNKEQSDFAWLVRANCLAAVVMTAVAVALSTVLMVQASNHF